MEPQNHSSNTFTAISSWAQILLDLMLPPHCAGCGKLGNWLCDDCIERLPRIKPPVCRKCGAPTAGLEVCGDCWGHRRYTESVKTPFYYEGFVRAIVHRLKFRRARYLAPPLGALMTSYYRTLPWIGIDCFVAVPLHENRQRERGYNQSSLLAEQIAEGVGIPLLDGGVKRVRDTSAQMGLPGSERPKNVRGAFQAQTSLVRGKTIVLIDDVCTTTATLESCARALRQAGATKVYGLALARARLRYRSGESPIGVVEHT